MVVPIRRAAYLVPLIVLYCTAAAAGRSASEVYDALAAARGFSQVAISPDGKQAAWVQSGTEIWVAGLPRGPVRRLAAGHNLAWSPDSRRLAFLENGQLQTVDAAGGKPRTLTGLTGFLADPSWSPDGREIAVLFTENAPRAAGPLEPVVPETGVVGTHIYNQRLTVVDARSGGARQVSPPDLYVYEYDWSPDGRAFAATAAPGPGDDNWYVAKLYRFDAATGACNVLLKPPLQIAGPKWSPDGGSIAYIGGLMSDEGMTGGDIFVVPANGGEPRNVTPGMSASASALHWAGGRIFFSELVDGRTGVASVGAQGGRVETLWTGAGVTSTNGWLPGISLARDGTTSAVIRHSFDEPPEILAGPIGGWKQITQLNGGVRPLWGEAKSIHWHSDGRQVQGWLLAPREVNPNRKYPLVVSVHGGPAGMASSHWPSTRDYATMLAARDYFVLFPNPRGSMGSGEDFTRANVKDFGYGDLRDILAGVDEALRVAPIDPGRVGVTGWSYGGYMTMWSVTQTSRFRAAVAGAGVANWQSYYGQNQIDQWMIPYFGASVYDDPAVYAQSSPINFIRNVKTPTLILVGDRDAECPAPQSWEFWHALKALRVETQFVIYPNEGHSINQPEHQRDVAVRALGWFDAYLKR